MKRDTEIVGLITAAAVVVIGCGGFLWIGGCTSIHRVKLTTVTAELGDIRASLGKFYGDFGHYPTGTATDIIEALMGKNPSGLRYLVLSSSGSPFQDPWREAYILIPASGSRGPEFYSKGPDMNDDRCVPSSDDIRSGPP